LDILWRSVWTASAKKAAQPANSTESAANKQIAAVPFEYEDNAANGAANSKDGDTGNNEANMIPLWVGGSVCHLFIPALATALALVPVLAQADLGVPERA
jgi:hypothetical protein